MTVSKPIPFEARTRLLIPLVSAKVQAGFPSPADDHMERSLDLNEHLVANPASTFFVRVQGDFTVKRLRKRQGKVFLEAENYTFLPLEVTENQELVIWGAVTFVIHQPR